MYNRNERLASDVSQAWTGIIMIQTICFAGYMNCWQLSNSEDRSGQTKMQFQPRLCRLKFVGSSRSFDCWIDFGAWVADISRTAAVARINL
jgi:hypothetical protein